MGLGACAYVYFMISKNTFFFQVHQETSSSQIEKLTNRLDDVEAKCLYCGGKMESLIDVLQEEITSLSGLEDETENTLLLSLAGLKHVGVVWVCPGMVIEMM